MQSSLDGSQSLELTLNSRRIVRRLFLVCVLVELSLVALDALVNYARWIDVSPIRRLFNITREDGLASWFAVTQTMLLALTLWAIWLVSRRISTRWTSRSWLVLALLFTYMAIDDGATIHERLGSALKESRAGEGPIGGFPSYAWQIIFVPPFALLGVFMVFFLLRQFQTRLQRIAVIAALGCMAAAVGLDFFEGLDPDHDWNLYSMIAERFDFESFTRRSFSESEFATFVHFSKSVEELLEMFAITLLWTASLWHLAACAADVRIRWSRE